MASRTGAGWEEMKKPAKWSQLPDLVPVLERGGLRRRGLDGGEEGARKEEGAERGSLGGEESAAGDGHRSPS